MGTTPLLDDSSKEPLTSSYKSSDRSLFPTMEVKNLALLFRILRGVAILAAGRVIETIIEELFAEEPEALPLPEEPDEVD